MDKHLLHIYTGDGKGKTTAGMGQALRALGHGHKVVITQYLKDGTSGELTALSTFPNAILHEGVAMRGFVYTRTPEQREKLAQQYLQALEELILVIEREQPFLTLLDELNVALSLGLVAPSDATRLIDTALLYGDVVVTGRHASEALIARADYVTRMEAVKHPFDNGMQARRGIEF